MDSKDGLVLLAHAGGLEVREGGATYTTFFAGLTVLSGDAIWVDTTGDGLDDHLFAAAVINGTPNTLRLAWTTAALEVPTTVTLDPNDTNPMNQHCETGTNPANCPRAPGRNLEPARVELAASTTRLAVVFTGHSRDIPVLPANQGDPPYAHDAFGWAFLSFFLDVDGDGYPAAPANGTVLAPSLLDPDDTDPLVVP